MLDSVKGSGAASALVDEYEKQLLHKGIKDYTLFVYVNNARARRFYEKKGFLLARYNDIEAKYYKVLVKSDE